MEAVILPSNEFWGRRSGSYSPSDGFVLRQPRRGRAKGGNQGNKGKLPKGFNRRWFGKR